MKKIFTCAILVMHSSFALVSTSFAPKDIAFQQGFEAGLKMLNFQLINEGATAKELKYQKQFLILLDITKMPMTEVLYLQSMLNMENYPTMLTRYQLIIGDYEREADAKNISNRINKDHDIFTVVRENQNETYYSYPILYEQASQIFLTQVRNDGIFVEKQIIYEREPKNKIDETKEYPKEIRKKIIMLKYPKAMSYYDINFSKRTQDDMFHSNELQEKSITNHQIHGWDFEAEIETFEGEQFIKVKEKNIFFAIDDVLIEEKYFNKGNDNVQDE